MRAIFGPDMLALFRRRSQPNPMATSQHERAARLILLLFAVFKLVIPNGHAAPAASASVANPERPLVIAHRGASGYVPEHTLEAKAMAHALGADYLEQDLVLSKDDVPLVLHDIHLDTVTDVAQRFPNRKRSDGRYYALDFTAAEVKELRVSERFFPRNGKAVFAERFPVGRSTFRISTLEEELQLIQGLNQSTGRVVGICPELKQTAWHQSEGHDIIPIVVAILRRYGYVTKSDPCLVQGNLSDAKRLRDELGWKGRIMVLLGVRKSDDGTDEQVATAAKLKELAGIVDAIGPSIARVVTWQADGKSRSTGLTESAHAAGLLVHPYTVRRDELPKDCPSLDALHAALFVDAKVDGVFTDFTDLTADWLKSHSRR
jgi:glycerophosphoryl diester phosphodiesterase